MFPWPAKSVYLSKPYKKFGPVYRSEKWRYLARFVQFWPDLFVKALLLALDRREATKTYYKCLMCRAFGLKGLPIRRAEMFFSPGSSSVNIHLSKVSEVETVMGKAVDYILINIFEPCLNWALSHPILSVVVVGFLIFVACRNYRMIWFPVCWSPFARASPKNFPTALPFVSLLVAIVGRSPVKFTFAFYQVGE